MPAVEFAQAHGAGTKEWKGASLKDFSLDDEGSFSAMFSTFHTIDKQNDLVLPGAFGEQRVVISAYGHGSWSGALPVGKGRIFETAEGGVVEGRFFLDTAAGADTHRTVRNLGDLQEWSYSLPSVVAEQRMIDGRNVRVLKKITVNEVSPVLLAASIGTRTLAIKGCGNCGTPEACSACPNQGLKEIFERLERDRTQRLVADYVSPQEAAEILAEAKRLLERPLPEIGIRYREINAAAVDPAVREAAEVALEKAWKMLGEPYPVRMIWVQPEDASDRKDFERWGMRWWKSHLMSDHVGGWAWKKDVDVIHVVACTDPDWAARTVAHELKHLVQPEGLFDPEKNAEEFVEQFLSTSRR